MMRHTPLLEMPSAPADGNPPTMLGRVAPYLYPYKFEEIWVCLKIKPAHPILLLKEKTKQVFL